MLVQDFILMCELCTFMGNFNLLGLDNLVKAWLSSVGWVCFFCEYACARRRVRMCIRHAKVRRRTTTLELHRRHDW